MKKARAPRISLRDWNAYRSEIEVLYVKQGKSLEKVAATLSQRHGFEAQKCQYKAQIAKWGFRKNSRRSQHKWEHSLSMQPSKEQLESWASEGRVLIDHSELSYSWPSKHLVIQCLVSLIKAQEAYL
jgi:hypothetical protein